MTIRDIGPGPNGPDGPRRVREKEEWAKRESASSRSPAAREDRVEISDAGRALSAQGSQLNDTQSIQTSERLDQIRERIQSGAYDSPEMAENVARRLLYSGDL